MAKEKVEKPKKAGKSTAIKEAITTLRRSPRKGVSSVYKTDVVAESAVAKVVKKASPAKKSVSPAKNVSPTKKSTSPTKSILPAKISASPTKNTSPKKALKSTASNKAGHTKLSSGRKASTTPAAKSASATPRPRGRPRKNVTAETTSPDTASHQRSATSSKQRSRSHSIASGARTLPADGSWTDSPKKNSQSKRSLTDSVNSVSEDDLTDYDVIHVRKSSVGSIRKSIETNNLGTNVRGRSKSPSKRTTKSPVRRADKSSTKTTRRGSSVQSLRSPSRSPGKAGGSAESVQLTTRSGRSRSPVKTTSQSPSADTLYESIAVGKARSSRSPAKQQTQKPSRTRSASPVKSRTVTNRARRSSVPAVSPARPRTQSPPKNPNLQSHRALSDIDFQQRFGKSDEYGRELRRTESAAYKSRKEGTESTRHNQHISRSDETRAKQRGFQRAELESRLHETAGARKQIIRRNSDSRDVRRLGGVANKNNGRRPLFYDQYKDQAKLHRPSFGPIRGEDELAGPADLQFIRASPSRSTASEGHHGSPEKSRSQNRSSPSLRSSPAAQSTTSSPDADPSPPDQDTVHSVTNPEFIPGIKTKKRNPFFEMIPRPDVWHRRMPSFLPFGETPAMELEVSRQISEDLSKGKEQPENAGQSSWFPPWVPVLGKDKRLSSTKVGYKQAQPWALPNVSEADVAKADVAKAADELRAATKSNPSPAGSKRKWSGTSATAVKRARRRSSGQDEFFMSGALQS